MPRHSGVDIVGDKELVRRFQKVANFADSRRVESAMYRVARHVAGNARRNLHTQVRTKTGRLSRSIQAGRFRRKLRAFPGAWVMADRKVAPHAHLIEYGHAVVRGGKVVGHAPAMPFLRPALDMSGGSLRASVRRAVPRAIHDAIARAGG